MAAEDKRGCGYRKVGGLYFVGGAMGVPCDRLPFLLESCPVCGAGIHFTRSMTEINPLKLFGSHDQPVKVFEGEPELEGEITQVLCYDEIRPCWMCDPTEAPAYIMTVGAKFYPSPADFMEEAKNQGISKRIPFIPKNFTLGETIIYLAHNKACVTYEVKNQAVRNGVLPGMETDEQKEVIYHLGIFSVFKPIRVEKLFWNKDLDDMSGDEKEDLEKRGITPVGIPDGDKDHS